MFVRFVLTSAFVRHGSTHEPKLTPTLSTGRTQEETAIVIAELTAERSDLKSLLLAALQRLEAVNELVQRAEITSAVMEDKVTPDEGHDRMCGSPAWLEPGVFNFNVWLGYFQHSSPGTFGLRRSCMARGLLPLACTVITVRTYSLLLHLLQE